MRSHELAQELLKLPNVDVAILQHQSGQFVNANSVRYGSEQDHSSGDLILDESGNIECLVKIE